LTKGGSNLCQPLTDQFPVFIPGLPGFDLDDFATGHGFHKANQGDNKSSG
jgi:hypothetical protein